MPDNLTVSMVKCFEFVVVNGVCRVGFGREIMMANVVIMAMMRGMLAAAIIIMTITVVYMTARATSRATALGRATDVTCVVGGMRVTFTAWQ